MPVSTALAADVFRGHHIEFAADRFDEWLPLYSVCSRTMESKDLCLVLHHGSLGFSQDTIGGSVGAGLMFCAFGCVESVVMPVGEDVCYVRNSLGNPTFETRLGAKGERVGRRFKD